MLQADRRAAVTSSPGLPIASAPFARVGNPRPCAPGRGMPVRRPWRSTRAAISVSPVPGTVVGLLARPGCGERAVTLNA